MSYAIPTNELTLTDIKAFRGSAVEAGIFRALELSIAATREELVTREALPSIDFPGAWTNDYYIGPAIAAVGWGWGCDIGAVGVLPVGRISAFYKCADADDNPAYTAVQFTVGPTRATSKAQFFIQLMIDNKMESDVYFSEPVVFDPQDNVGVRAYSRIAVHDAEELSFGCFIIEKLGAVIS